jgi:hypothetical protein
MNTTSKKIAQMAVRKCNKKRKKKIISVVLPKKDVK